MNIESSTSRGVLVLACSGELKLGSGDDALGLAFDEAVATGARLLVLDLSRLKWMDSAGIGAVVRCGKHAAEKGAVLKIVVAAEGRVRKILSVTQLDRAFEIFDELEPALASFPT